MNTKIPFLIVITGLILCVFMAILFGISEDIFKDKIKNGLENNTKIQQIVDPDQKQAKLDKEAGKNWRYYQRFHFHSTGISAMSLGLLILLSSIITRSKLKPLAAYATSIGGLLYPFVWLFAALYGPEMGRHEAKEMFAIFGYMGGVFLFGVLLILYLWIRYPTRLQLNKEAE